MANINSLISNYLKNGKNPRSEADVKKAIENLKLDSKNAYHDACDRTSNYQLSISTFSNSDSMNRDDFISMIVDATGKDDSSTKDYAGILFDILDTSNEANGSLSADELNFLAGNDNDITYFDLFNKLSSYDEASVNKETKSSSSSSGTSESSESSSSSAASGSETSDSTSTGSSDDSKNTSFSTEKPDFNDAKAVKNWLTSIADCTDDLSTPEDVVSWLLSIDAISKEEAETIRNTMAATTYSDKEEGLIQALVNLGMTREEAIEKLEKEGKITGKDNSAALKAVISNKFDPSVYADELKSALGTKDVDRVMAAMSSEMSFDEFVSVIEYYEEHNGSGVGNKGLIARIDEQIGDGDNKKNIMKVLAYRLGGAAENGNDKAVDLLCKEIYSATAGRDMGTAEDFLTAVFGNDGANKFSNDLLIKINQRYPSVKPGHTMKDDIKGDYSCFWETWGDDWKIIKDRLKEIGINV